MTAVPFNRQVVGYAAYGGTNLMKSTLTRNGYRTISGETRVPLYYKRVECIVSGWTSPSYKTDGLVGASAFLANLCEGDPNILSQERALVYNKAYERFADAVHSATAGLGETLGEWSSTHKMVQARSPGSLWRTAVQAIERSGLTLFRCLQHLRRGRFRRFLETLGISPKREHRRKRWNTSREVSGLFLEYHLGWEPLIKTIYDAVDVLQGEPPPLQVTARATMTWLDVTKGSDTYGKYKYWLTMGERLQGEVRITNPNLLLANQLGVANPAAVLWALVPFSFVVDWFVNVGNFLNSWSDFLGVQVTGIIRTRRGRSIGTRTGKSWYAGTFDSTTSGHANWLERTLPTSVPGVKLVPYQVKGLSVARGATAIALVVSLLAPKS